MEAQKFIVVFVIGAYPESEAFRSQRCYTSLRFMSVSLSSQRIGLSPGLFPSGFVIKVLHKFLSSFVHDIYLPNLSLFLLVTQTKQQLKKF